MEVLGRRYENGEPVRLVCSGHQIVDVIPHLPVGAVDELPMLAPGLFDLQINGYGGTWFSDVTLTPEKAAAAVRSYLAHGVTRLFPTLVTNSREALINGFRAIDAACREDPLIDDMVVGCHLEGPYISAEDGPRGAHPLAHVRAPDWSEFEQLQEASGNRIKLLTLSPEWSGSPDFIGQCVRSGVVVSIGHTSAEAEQISAAIDAGATLSTHLGNGAHGQIRRHPNYIWDQLGSPELWTSMITDGHHLPDSVIRAMMAARGSMHSIITCDASGLAGCPPGQYDEGDISVEILEDGRLVLAGQRQLLAGSGVTTEFCVGRAVQSGAVGLRTAWDMASVNPARLCGLEEIRLQRGCRADLVLFRTDEQGRIHIEETIVNGASQFVAESTQSV